MRHPFAVAVAFALAGCTTYSKVKDPERFEQVTGVDQHSSYPAVRRESFEWVNFLELVDPERKAMDKFDAAWKKTLDSSGEIRRTATGDSSVSYGAQYDLVLSWFRQTTDIADAEKQRRRNGIQERMLSVSLSRCNVFKTYLRRDQADTNFLFGALTTVSGILGAVLQGVNSSRNLAGAAGLFSGIRSEYNQAYYSNLAAHVIIKGIEAKQEEVYKRIQSEGQSKSIEIYPLDAGIKDAIYFDGLCSVVTGLDKAAVSVDTALEPGIDAAMRTVLRARLLKEAADLSAADLLKPGTLDRFGTAGSRLGLSLVGSARPDTGPAASEVDLYAAIGNLIDRLKTSVNDTAAKLDKAAMARKAKLLGELTSPDQAALAKTLSALPPKDGEVAASVAAAIDKGLIKELGLDTNACFVMYAAPAIAARGDAAKAKKTAADIKEEEKKKKADAQAEYLLKKAARAIQQSHDDISRIETLVALDLGVYQSRRLKEIDELKIDAVKTSGNWRALTSTGDIAPNESADARCKP